VNDTYVTLTGVVASQVNRKQLTDGTPLTTFRLAARTRRWDYRTKAFVDGETTWATVTCWRGLAVNVGHSVVKHDRVVVRGRVRTPEWTDSDGARHSYLDVVADAVGHDLAWGTSVYTKVVRAQSVPNPAQAEADEAARALTLDSARELSEVFGRGPALDSTGPSEPDPGEEPDEELDDDLDEGLDDEDESEQESVRGGLVGAGRR
jgi:single-strand DNA-binding protein